MSEAGADTLFRGVDRAAFAAAFSERLRLAGSVQTMTMAGRFAAALEVADPRTRDELYWVARTCLVSDVGDEPAFDAVFGLVFDASGPAVDPHARRSAAHGSPPPADEGDLHVRVPLDGPRAPGGGGVPWTTPPSATEPDHDLTPSVELALPLPSGLADRTDVPFDRFDEDELELLGAWLERTVVHWPRRRARRRRPTSLVRDLDRRRTVRGALRTVGEPIVLHHSRAVTRPRGIVMLVDVSGSMQPYARAYLHLMRALGRTTGAETFAFSTRLTRLTATLQHRDVRTAVARATAEVDDRFSGTRIANSLGQLMRHPAWSTSVRGSVVIIASDGWDTDPLPELEARMRRLRRLAHHIVWVNPRSARLDYEPLVSGMAGALPHCDTFVSGHSLAAVEDLLRTVACARSPSG
ncbi:MAG: VWA domain-containing protein [Nitriliruptor sp.]|uniref:VWA domain-containing protein n=1 Tax=Nitriliruptor sp. TaxID=2448056 RepID=UPI0034A01F36